jgi:hypothetical protein
VRFFDPHPGFGGAMIALPEPFVSLAKELDGQEMTLVEAVAKIEAVIEKSGLPMKVRIVDKYEFISVDLGEGDGYPRHSWRLIRYSPNED